MNSARPDDGFPHYSPEWPVAPAGFADRVLASWLVAHRARRRRVWLVRAGGLALAGSVALAVIFGGSAPTKPVPEVVSIPSTLPKIEPSAPIQKPFTDAGEALAAITRKTTDKALAPSRTVLASAGHLPVPGAVEPPTALETKGWTDAAEGARAGLDPVAGQPRRAVTLMLRDLGIAPPSKPRS